jgi:hypothetical protein
VKEPIEGDYRVVGEKRPPEPIIKSWPALWSFVAAIVLAMLMKLAFMVVAGWFIAPG